MKTKIIEVTEPTHFNWGKFMVAQFTDEWSVRSAVGAEPYTLDTPLLTQRGWSPESILVVDLETGEGAIFARKGLASADLNKHQIWVCPMFEPFLSWLYQQDLTDITKLPAHVELPKGTPTAMHGYRREGKTKREKEKEHKP